MKIIQDPKITPNCWIQSHLLESSRHCSDVHFEIPGVVPTPRWYSVSMSPSYTNPFLGIIPGQRNEGSITLQSQANSWIQGNDPVRAG